MSFRAVRLMSLLLLTAACGTVSTVRQPASTPATTEIPQAVWPEFYLPRYDSVTAAAGLPSLRRDAAPRGTREARVWISGPGDDVELYRFVEARGRVSGALLLAWEADTVDPPVDGHPGVTWHDLAVHRMRGPCREFFVERSVGGCHTTFRSPPDWPGTFRRLEATGLWELPDQSALPRRVTPRDTTPGAIVFDDVWVDGSSITVELRSDVGYRTYQYNNPAGREHPEQERAAELMRIVGELSELLPAPESLRTYRGQLGGPGRSEFRPCGSREVWEVDPNLIRHAASRVGIELPVVLPRDTAVAVYAELRGELAPAWLARWWGSERDGVLSVLEVSAIRPWAADGC